MKCTVDTSIFEKLGVGYFLKAVVNSERCCRVTDVANIMGMIRSQDDRLQLTTLNGQPTKVKIKLP